MVNPSELNEFLARYSPEIQKLALQARELVFEIIPGAVEQIDSSAGMIAYGTGAKMGDIICTIHPYKTTVNLGLYRAVELPDPQGILEGTGKLHRHVKLRTVADIQRPAVRELLLAAKARKS
jgi:hypothetical protein